MAFSLHSGHLRLASRYVPAKPSDCRTVECSLKIEQYRSHLTKLGGKLSLPKLPDTINLLNAAIKTDEPDFPKIIKIIEDDTMLSGDIINTLRQPTFQSQLKRPIDIANIKQCVHLIGSERLYQLALASSMKQVSGTNDFVKHLVGYATKTAYACAEIAGYLPPQQHPLTQEKAYLFGLYLHSGMMALAGHYNAAYVQSFKQSLTLPQTAHAQELAYFAPHDQLGVLVAMQWGINEKYVANRVLLTAIAYHHHPNYQCIDSDEIRLMIATGLLAQSLVSELVYQLEYSVELTNQQKKACQVIGLSEEALNNIRKNLSSFWKKRS